MASSTAFIDELNRWGPEAWNGPAPSLRASRAYCRRLARTHYENFTVVSWLLPRHLHRHFYHVYAFCRWADDLADEVDSTSRALELLGWWREQLGRCFRQNA